MSCGRVLIVDIRSVAFATDIRHLSGVSIVGAKRKTNMSCYSKDELEQMLEDVVNALGLADKLWCASKSVIGPQTRISMNPALEKDVDKPYSPPSTPCTAFRQEKRISSYLGEEKRFLGHSDGEMVDEILVGDAVVLSVEVW